MVHYNDKVSTQIFPFTHFRTCQKKRVCVCVKRDLREEWKIILNTQKSLPCIYAVFHQYVFSIRNIASVVRTQCVCMCSEGRKKIIIKWKKRIKKRIKKKKQNKQKLSK